MRVVSLAHDMSTDPPLHPYQILSNYLNSMGVLACTRFRIQGIELYNEDSESCYSRKQHTYWPYSSFLPNIIKICLRVSKLWPAQDFRFRGDNYTRNKVRVVSLTRDTTTGPLHPYQILSNYLKQYGSYGLHKISASGEITI